MRGIDHASGRLGKGETTAQEDVVGCVRRGAVAAASQREMGGPCGPTNSPNELGPAAPAAVAGNFLQPQSRGASVGDSGAHAACHRGVLRDTRRRADKHAAAAAR